MRQARSVCVCLGAALGISLIAAPQAEARRLELRRINMRPGSAAWAMNGARRGVWRGIRNSALKGNGSPSYYNYATDPAVSAEVKRMEKVLNERATPGFNIFVFSKPGVQIGQSAGGDHLKICSGGKACTIDAIAVMPTSGHVPSQTAQQLAKDQRHTLWHVAGRPNPGDKSNILIDGAQSRGQLVTVVKFKMPLQPGNNFLYFDPYPGRTAGVGGFSAGRTHKFVVE